VIISLIPDLPSSYFLSIDIICLEVSVVEMRSPKSFSTISRASIAVFLDRSLPHSEIVAVTTIVGGKTYGSAEGTTSVIASENAAIVTLSAWLKEELNL
jgi:hypothetical protein